MDAIYKQKSVFTTKINTLTFSTFSIIINHVYRTLSLSYYWHWICEVAILLDWRQYLRCLRQGLGVVYKSGRCIIIRQLVWLVSWMSRMSRMYKQFFVCWLLMDFRRASSNLHFDILRLCHAFSEGKCIINIHRWGLLEYFGHIGVFIDRCSAKRADFEVLNLVCVPLKVRFKVFIATFMEHVIRMAG